MSKVIANRLKSILSKIISETQSAFVPGRLITNNVLVVFETLHYMKTRCEGRKGYMAIKLDMSKAYDRVEWGYLCQVMRKMGFEEKWTSLIMQCISSVSYFVLINGEPRGSIHPERGLCQGDPLSPYLFLICAEGLLAKLKEAKLEGKITGVAISRGGPKITNLCFADDSLLLCWANIEECRNILQILQKYEVESGQKLNQDKTTIYFSKNVEEDTKNAIQARLKIPEIKEFEKYFGMPSFVGRNKKASFSNIKERVWRVIQGWGEKMLSQAGMEILIKAVAQAIPTNVMSCFRLSGSPPLFART